MHICIYVYTYLAEWIHINIYIVCVCTHSICIYIYIIYVYTYIILREYSDRKYRPECITIPMYSDIDHPKTPYFSTLKVSKKS